MLDPLTISAAVATANTAFNGLKRAFQVGKDIQSMGQDLSKWMSAASDIENAQKRAKNPSFITKLTRRGSIEQEAVEALTAKKQLEAQRYELQQFIKFRHGVQAWNELLKMEGDIRKRRQKEIYDKQVLRQKIITVIVLILCVIVGMGILLAFVYGLVQLDRGKHRLMTPETLDKWRILPRLMMLAMTCVYVRCIEWALSQPDLSWLSVTGATGSFAIWLSVCS